MRDQGARTAYIRRALHRVATVTSLVLLVVSMLSLVPVGAQDPPPPPEKPLLYRGLAGGAGVSVSINTEPRLLPLEDFVRGDAPQADSEMTSNGIAQARASSYYPGTSGTGGPGLMCTLMARPDFDPCRQISEGSGQPFPPQYPLTADAQFPTQPDAQTQDGLAQAHAHEHEVWSLASGSSNANEPNPSPIAPLREVLSIGAAEARTRQEFLEGAFVVTAESHLDDVNIAGQIRIASIDAVSVSRANGDDPSQSNASFTVSGMTVAGHPVSLSDQGVTVDAEQQGGAELAEANRQLNAFLNERQVTIRVLNPTTTQDGKNSTGHAPGLLIEMRIPVANPTDEDLPSLPIPPEVPIPNPDPNSVFRTYLVTYVLGQAGSAAFASNDPFDTSFGLGGGGLGTIGGDVGGDIGGGGTVGSGDGGTVGSSSGSLPGSSGSSSFTSDSSIGAVPTVSGGETPAPESAPAPEVAPAEGGTEGMPEQLLAALGLDRGTSWLFNPFLLPIALLLFTLTRALPEAARRQLIPAAPQVHTEET